MKKVLICGANGFIGKNLLKRFYDKAEYDIRAVYFNSSPDHDYDVEWVKADLRKIEDVKRVMGDVDIVLQYAATSTGAKDILTKPYVHVTDNAVMNSLLFREAFDRKIKHFVMPSCTVMYRSSDQIITEDDFDENIGVSDIYYGAGNTKVYLEKMCKFYSSFGTTKFTVIRQSNIYGPYDNFGLEKSHVFGATITKAMTFNNKITVWGTGEEERDFLFVGDLIELVETCLENQKSTFELVNGSCGSSVSITDLVKKVVGASGRDLKIEYDSFKPTIKTKLAIDNKKAKKVFGWSPSTSLDDGITKTIEWYRKEYQWSL
jgi:nucleoside-diphosphate-sugar epimerase